MSPPIRDGSGSSIGSIRLGDGSEIAEVRTGAGDVLFSAIPDSVIDNFEDGPNGVYQDTETISDYYGGDTGVYERQTATVFEGSYALKCSGSTNGETIVSTPTDGLNNYVSRGNQFQTRARHDSNVNGIAVVFGAQDVNNHYFFEARARNGDIQVVRVDSGSRNLLSEKEVTVPRNEWNYLHIDWASDDTITCTLKDSTESNLASTSVTDSTYSNAEGIGFSYNTDSTSHEGFFDLYEVF